jgi:hypothetical protein
MVLAPVAGGGLLLYRATINGYGGDRLAFFATSSGWVVVACEGTDGSALHSCEGMAVDARMLGTEPRSIGPSRTVADDLNAVLVKVATARRAAKGDLSSSSMRLRAHAAFALANVMTEAAGTITSVEAGPSDTPELRRAGEDMRIGAIALRDLVVAAQQSRSLKYERAMRRLERTEADFATALMRAGYRLPSS